MGIDWSVGCTHFCSGNFPVLYCELLKCHHVRCILNHVVIFFYFYAVVNLVRLMSCSVSLVGWTNFPLNFWHKHLTGRMSLIAEILCHRIMMQWKSVFIRKLLISTIFEVVVNAFAVATINWSDWNSYMYLWSSDACINSLPIFYQAATELMTIDTSLWRNF